MVINKGQKFTSKWFAGEVEVMGVDPSKNSLSVKITRSSEHYHTEEWNLEHTLTGFERGDYKSI